MRSFCPIPLVVDARWLTLLLFCRTRSRIDFRELVRDLFAIYKTRIWLQQVVPSGKKLGDGDAN